MLKTVEVISRAGPLPCALVAKSSRLRWILRQIGTSL
jgi:hypothetical protein